MNKNQHHILTTHGNDGYIYIYVRLEDYRYKFETQFQHYLIDPRMDG